jgi:hypothetical protein
LLNGDGRRQTFDEINVWFFHAIEELPRIGGKTFHVAALPFGIERVEGERRLPRAAQPGYDDQLVPRNFDVEIL